MKTLKNWVFLEEFKGGISLFVNEKHKFSIFVLEPNLMRVLIQKNNELALDRTWSIAPENDVPIEGRNRLSLDGFSCPQFKCNQTENYISLETDLLKVIIHQPLYLEWFYRKNINENWQLIAKDRKTGAYQLGRKNYTNIAHFLHRFGDEQFYGLGEKAGNLNRAGNRYEMRNLDAMGYNAEKTDPLYKHIPFTITRRNNVSFGLFYDNLANCFIDLGNELDNYHAYFRKYEADSGDLDFYFFAANKVVDITKQFVRLTGKTIFSPKWSLGYSGSTMRYTDAENAQEQLIDFISLCQKHKIPCDSFQLSSGYTSIGDKRYVFNWNTKKFPNINALSETFKNAGIRFAANIKPCLLHDHPQYESLKNETMFVLDSEKNQPEISVFWDDEGSHVDFTNPKTFNWWKQNVKSALLEKGIGSTWNDNNEYEIWDRDARCNGFGKEIPIKLIRPVMPLLMMRASKEAQESFAPNERPYLISRSGCAGMQRYVQTWSGDNRSNWNTLKYNTKMGLGMSLSGLYNIGHDVGGFAGKTIPDAELFVRWIQNGIMHPRFTIHSWYDDKSVNEPWMHEKVTPIIRDTIQLRYRLLPYFYHLLWLAHINDEPFLRPTFLDHENDEKTFEENDDFLVGKSILVSSIVEPNQTKRKIYLPQNHVGWYSFYDHNWFSGGQTISVDAPLHILPLMIKAGSIIPCSKRFAFVDFAQDNVREFLIFPHKKSGESEGNHFEDDGLTKNWQNNHLLIDWKMQTKCDRIDLTLNQKGNFKPAFEKIECILPKTEKRPLYINGELTQYFMI